MSVFIGNKNKRVELAERKDATNPNLLEKSKSFIMFTPWGTVKCGNTIHCTTGTGGTGSIYLSSDPNNPGLKENASAYFSCEPNTYYTESLWITSSVALNGVESHIDFQNSSIYTNATTIGAKTINLGNNHYRIVGSFYSGTNMANFDIGYITAFSNFVGVDSNISFDALKIEKGAVATDWCPALEDYAWTSDITNLQNTVNNIDSTRTPVVAGASDDDLFAFKTNQIRLYDGNGKTCKNLPPAANTQYFTVQYVFEGPNNDGIAIYRTPSNEIWTAGCNGESYANGSFGYTGGWVRVANSTDVSNLQSMITGLQSQIQAQQTAVSNIQTGYMKKPTVISQADYDKLATKDPNTLYEITE